MLAVFAQAVAPIVADPIASWSSVILQGSAFGLLVYIVVRLYPQESRLAREERQSRDDRFDRVLAALQTKFEERNDKIIIALKEQTNILSATQKESAERIEKAVEQVCHAPR